MTALAGVLLGLEAILADGLARPAPREGAVVLDWRAPRGCPDAARVEATIDRLVGPRAARPASAEPSARVQAIVHARPEGFRLELHTRQGGAAEHRTVTAARCEALADAAALIVAVALRPIEAAAAVPVLAPSEASPRPVAPPLRTSIRESSTTVASSFEPSPQGALREGSPPALASSPGSPTAGASSSEPAPEGAPSRREVADPSRRAVGGALAVALGPGLGVLPGVAAQLTAALALRGRRWRAEVAGSYWFSRTAASVQQPTVEIGLAAAAVRGCYVPRVRRVELPLCAGLDLGSMRGEGRGAGVRSSPSREAWVAAHAGPGLAVPLGPWAALRLSVDGLVTLRQPGFDLRVADQRIELFRAPPVGVRAGMGLELRWP